MVKSSWDRNHKTLALQIFISVKVLFLSLFKNTKSPLCKQYQLLKYTRDKRREGMIINMTEWNRRKRRENILMAGVISPDITRDWLL